MVIPVLGDGAGEWPTSHPTLRPGSSGPPTVLIVEDTPDHAEIIWVMLAHARGPRWKSATAGTLAEARAWLRENHADVALLDLNLPDSRGPHTAGLLCREFPELPVVIHTALTDESVALAALQQGAQDHLVKGQFEGALLSRTLRLAVERKRAELAHARLAAIVENSDDAIIGATLDGIVVAWNAGAARMYGCSAAEALGHPLDTLVRPENPEALRQALPALRRGEHVDPFETTVRKDGRSFHTSLAVSPVRDGSGRINGLSAIARTISEATRSRIALREREETFRLLFERNPQPMWVFDWETLRLLEVNEAAILHYGYARDEFVGMRLQDLFSPDEAARLEKHLESGRLASFHTTTWRQVKKDGDVIDVEASGEDIPYGGRRARLVVVHDVTERTQLQGQLLQSQKMDAIGRLAGGVAHDFNNLLGVITGYTELLRKDLREPRAQARADEVLKAAGRASSLTRQLLTFSRKELLQPKVVDLSSVAANVESMLRRLIGEDIELVTAYAPDLGQVRADPSRIEQVLLNLAVNARDAMPGGGRLIIETQNVDLDASYEATHPDVAPGRYVIVAVSDTGIGMTPAVLARVFEPFFTTKKAGEGTGLGLATVYGIVKQSGGQVFVYSEPGQGTTFKVYLPRVDAAAETSRGAEKEPLVGGSETILLVEDDDSLRNIVGEMLTDVGYTVLSAESAAQALRMVEEATQPIHLLLTDMVMRDRSGRALAVDLHRAEPSLKVVYMSGYTDEKVTRDGALSPGDHFIEKPFSQESLLQKVRGVLDA